MSKTETKLTEKVALLQEKLEKRQNQVNRLKAQLEKKKEAIRKKNEKLRDFKTKAIFTRLNQKIVSLQSEIEDLKQTILNRQTKGCYECKESASESRLVKFSNISICLECIHKAETKHWSGQ